MRKTTAFTALFFIFLLAATAVFAQRAHTRRTTARTTTRVIPPVITIDTAVIAEEALIPEPGFEQNKTWPWPKCESTEKINASNRCEAYPWLSGDGLRLYFSSNRDGGHGNIYFTERSSVNEPFSKVDKLFRTKENRYYAASLSNDELTMYLTLEGYTLYIAERKSKTEPFGTPRIIPELKNRKLYGPSVTPDGNELVAIDYNAEVNEASKKSGRITVWFVKGADGKFVEKGRLETPQSKVSGPGQLSKDGLTYYCSIEDGYNQPEKLYCYTRNALGEVFSFSHLLPNEVNITKGSLQPSVNTDGTILAYTINNDGAWGGDDIRVVNLATPLKDDKSATETPVEPLLVAVKQVPVAETVKITPAPVKISAIDISRVVLLVLPKTVKIEPETIVRTSAVSIYPNPFKDLLTVEFVKPSTSKLLFELYDVNGKRVLAQQINGETTVAQVKTGNLPAGQFTCRISGSEGVVFSGTVVSGK